MGFKSKDQAVFFFKLFLQISILLMFVQVSSAQSNNTSTGTNAGSSITSGDNNSSYGVNAGRYTTKGSNNIFIGVNAGRDNTEGLDNTFIGVSSGILNTLGRYNTFIGRYSGADNTVGERNTFVGRSSGTNNTTGMYNTFVGMHAAVTNTTGSYNSFFGYQSGYKNITGSKNVFLGYKAGFYELASDKLYIENSNSTSPLIYGEFDNDLVQINGELRTTGGILTNEVTVKLQENWPDYVFSKNYQLPSLEEVEKHIKENKHLPGIPTAKDIEEKGLPMAKVVTKQMEKIEELTLYLIEKEKEIETLKEENRSLKNDTIPSIMERLKNIEGRLVK